MAKNVTFCQAESCKNTNKNSNLSFFCFPTNNPNRLEKWLSNIQMKQAVRSRQYLCSEHFELTAFTNTLKRRLLPYAVPTIQIPGSYGKISCSSAVSHKICSLGEKNTCASPPTPERNDVSKNYATPEKKVFTFSLTPKSRRLNRYKSVIYRLKKKLFFKNNSSVLKNPSVDALKTIKKDLRPALYNILEAQLRNSGPVAGRRWTASDKAFAFNIYITSPSAYRVLRRFLILPAIRTLRRSVQGVCQTSGFCSEIFEVLKQKASLLDEKQRDCVLSFDEMAIRPSLHYSSVTDNIMGYQDELSVRDYQNVKVATNTLVFMVRGLHANWKQILGYFLVHRSMPGPVLKELVISSIAKLQDIGLNVIAIVCDQGSNNLSLFSELGLTVDKTSFQVGNCDVFFMFDPPHLLKALRNNLLKHTLEYKRRDFGIVTASWRYIQDFFEIDRNNQPRVTPKLTKNHVNPVGRGKMKVKYAAQAMSRSVAAGISLLKSVGRFDDMAIHTSNFLEVIDKLFDSFNSRTLIDKKKLLCAVQKDSPHLGFWEEMLVFVQSWNFKNVNGKTIHTHCKKGWLITLQSAINLSRCTLQKHDIVLMRRLNQDALENTFSVIRSKRGNDTNPDCFQLISCLRAVMVNNIFTTSNNANCEEDFDKALISLKDTSASKYSNLSAIFSDHISVNSPAIDMPCLPSDVVRENVIYYIAGYIGRKTVAKLGDCTDCQRNLLLGNEVTEDYSLLTRAKDYSGNSLKKPSSTLFNLVKKMYDIDLAHIFWSKNVSQNMLNLYIDVIDFSYLNIHEIHKEKVKKIICLLIAKIQIYDHIKKVNNDLKAEFYAKCMKLK